MDPRTPVIVGVGQLTNRNGEPLSPLALMEEVARRAASDAGAPALLERLQSIVVVDAISQLLGDPAAALAAQLGATPQETVRTGLGGNGPQLAVNDIATRIAEQGLDVALIAGAEAMATARSMAKHGEQIPWALTDDRTATRQLLPDRPGSSDAEVAAGLLMPINVYPVFEHALRGAAGRSREDQLAHISALWSRFSEVAAGNEHAWSREPRTPEELATATDSNRRVSDPYLKLLNALIAVDQGAALLMCSAEAAQAAGVPRDRWVFIHAGGQAADHWFVTERDELHRSPAIRLAGAAAMEHAGVTGDDLAHVDLYSCFPSAVQIGAAELGLPIDRQLTQTGGLTFAGGPGNNYATHGIAAVASALREDPDAVGLATALGWFVTKHAVGVYSGRPPERPYRTFDVQDEVDVLPRRAVAENYDGPAIVESYTVMFGKDGSPDTGTVIGRLRDGRRAVAKTQDAGALAELTDGTDPLGREVHVTAPAGIMF
jgi:acetyl-CoA C-acetyltransferase